MHLDDKICYCYGVPMRKLMNFARRVRPARPSQMTECLNAGTGCGWCIPFLIKIASDPDAFAVEDMSPEEYAERRKDYIKTQPKNTFDGGNERQENEQLNHQDTKAQRTDEQGGHPKSRERTTEPPSHQDTKAQRTD